MQYSYNTQQKEKVAFELKACVFYFLIFHQMITQSMKNAFYFI